MTVADWDVQNLDNVILDNIDFISAPSSICAGAEGWIGAILSKHPDCQCLPQGQIEHWVRREENQVAAASIRNQNPLGTSNYTNTYLVGLLYVNGWGVWWRTTAGWQVVGSLPFPSGYDVWTHLRITWWETFDEEGNEATAFMMEEEVAGDWIDRGTIYDVGRHWFDSETQRVGHLLFRSTKKQNIDDTIIRRPC